MVRIGAGASALVAVVWVALTVGAIGSHDDLAGVAVVLLALYAAVAVLVIWAVVAVACMLKASRRAATQLRSPPPD